MCDDADYLDPFGIGERASREQRCPHHLKVTWKDNLIIGRLKLGGVGECLLGSPADGMEAPSEGKGIRGGNALDARNCSQLLFDFARKSSALSLCISAVSQNLKGQKPVRVKTRVDALQFEETAEHQS